MKWTVQGFHQPTLVALGMDCTDITFLRWFVDFQSSGDMDTVNVEGREYYWVLHDKAIKEMPVLGITDSRSMGRRLLKMVNAGVLERHIAHSKKTSKGRVAGKYTFYRTGDAYASLITSTSTASASQDTSQVSFEAHGSCLLKHDKDSSIKDSSIKDREEETPPASGSSIAVQSPDPVVARYRALIAEHLPVAAWTDGGRQEEALTELSSRTRELLDSTPIGDPIELATAIVHAFIRKKAEAKGQKSDYWRDADLTPKRLLQRFSEVVSSLAQVYEKTNSDAEAARRMAAFLGDDDDGLRPHREKDERGTEPRNPILAAFG